MPPKTTTPEYNRNSLSSAAFQCLYLESDLGFLANSRGV